MSIGFVYILLNPAFPRIIKIGRTARESTKRARELSRQTGVPDDFIILFDELVSDAEEVENLLHSRFAEYRVKPNKEYFQMPPREAIKALQEIAVRFTVPPKTPVLAADLWPHLQQHFSAYLAPNIKGVRFLQLPMTCCLEVKRQYGQKSAQKTEEPLPLWGLLTPANPTSEVLNANLDFLKFLDAYDWIMISDLFSSDAANAIAKEWECPGGKLEQRRQTAGGPT